MARSYASEWLKLRRPLLLAWGLGAGLGCTVLATVFTIEEAGQSLAHGSGRLGLKATIAELSQSQGIAHGLVGVSNLLGVIGLCLFAGAFATEFSQGTLRNLLVRQPRRVALLSGKFLAIATFLALAVVLAGAVSALAGLALGPGKGIHTAAWLSTGGANDLGQALLHVYLAALGYGVMGAALAVTFRSPPVAIAIGVAYALPGEAIMISIWEDGERWLPASLLSTLAQGGTSTVSYSHALLMTAIYASVACVLTMLLFARRDVR